MVSLNKNKNSRRNHTFKKTQKIDSMDMEIQNKQKGIFYKQKLLKGAKNHQ